MIPGQLEAYKKYAHVFREGDYYRLASFSENGEHDTLMAVTRDKRLAVVDHIQVVSRAKKPPLVIRLQGLDEKLYYRSSETGETHSGAAWMYGGMPMPQAQGDHTGKLIILEVVEK